MELLVVFLLLPAIFAQHYQQNPDPNNEPFLPIYPTYPYSPKLMKRGTERDVATPGSQDSYAPKQEAKVSSPSSFDGNIQKDGYFSAYNSFPKTSTPPISPFSSPFTSNPFGSNPFGTSPFSSNPFGSTTFSANPFNSNPYNALSSFSGAFQNPQLTQSPAAQFPPNAFPNFFQQPAFLPNFYNQYPPSLPRQNNNYPERYNEGNNDGDRRGKKGGKGRYKDDEEDSEDSQFTDGANFLSSNIRDLDGQSSTYKGTATYKSPNPNLADKLNGIPGQSANLDYPATTYIKPHQLEQLMRQTLIKLLAQNLGEPTSKIQYPQNSPNQNIGNEENSPRYVPASSGLAKTGLSYLVNPSIINIPENQNSPGHTQQTQAIIGKNQRYPDSQYQKPSALYVPKVNRSPGPIQSPDYGDFEAQPTQVDQSYQGTSNQDKRTNSKGQNLVTQTPQSSNYQHSSYQPTPTPKASEVGDLNNISINFNKPKEKRG